MNNGAVVLVSILVIIAAVTLGPLVTIWSLNTLFPVLAIPTTFWTWLATLCLGGGLSSIFKSFSSKES